MERTNIYLTREQQIRLYERAKEQGVSKSEVIRQLLDGALGITRAAPEVEKVLRASFGLWADRSDEEIEEILSWRREVPLERLKR